MRYARLTITYTDDEFYVASMGDLSTGKYVTREGALIAMCEHLYPLQWEPKPSGRCTCSGWGTPTGCPGCGTRCMGG